MAEKIPEGAFPPDDLAKLLYIGHHESHRQVPVTPRLLSDAQSLGYELLTAAVTTEHFRRRVFTLIEAHVHPSTEEAIPRGLPFPLVSPLTPLDTDLTPSDCNSSFIGVVSPWIDLGSPDPLIAFTSRKVLSMEVAYAAFCGVNNLLIHGPTMGSDYTQYARAIAECLGMGPYIQLHVLLPMTGELEAAEFYDNHLTHLAREEFVPSAEEEEMEAESALYSSWERWDLMRTMCNYSSKLSIALEMPRQLPPKHLQSRWCSEPVRLLVLSRTTFLRNAKGFPVLSRFHQQLLTRFISLRFAPWILLSDVDSILPLGASTAPEPPLAEPTPAEAGAMPRNRPNEAVQHLQYMRHLQQTQPSRPVIERFGQGYQDYMQSPLQPLTDNLESMTYEVFEKDPVKYEWYERAIAAAIKDIHAALNGSREIIVAVVGAGRGPLVTRVLQARRQAGIALKCCAVEKNPNAHVLICQKNATDPLWDNQVMIFKSDMRSWPGPTIDGQLRKVDILVSELLGSFGDNELSPECLDGVQHLLHPDHGVSIPQSYSAHLTPIASPKLHNDLLSRADPAKWDLPYVVMLHQYDFLCMAPSSSEGQPTPQVRLAWEFSHPVPTAVLKQSNLRAGGAVDSGGWTGGDGKNEHNARACRLGFHARNRGVCHGLAGYFETVLYAGSQRTVELSTNPTNMKEKSEDMISWFPIFFPLKTPLRIPDDAEIDVSMWRQTDDRQVWYEWMVEVTKTIDHNRMTVAVSELHSSRKNGCMI